MSPVVKQRWTHRRCFFSATLPHPRVLWEYLAHVSEEFQNILVKVLTTATDVTRLTNLKWQNKMNPSFLREKVAYTSAAETNELYLSSTTTESPCFNRRLVPKYSLLHEPASETWKPYASFKTNIQTALVRIGRRGSAKLTISGINMIYWNAFEMVCS